ncbi:hypothetical protein SPONN_697 [uncultured Candidatus Thioglobus sp.]|nr:hypothetical protein SPONN_697 [uncultured Candidatus Thioglobus sp.]
MFADDAKCAKLISEPSDCTLLQEDLNALCSWSNEWKMKFKESKCVAMSCCTRASAAVQIQYQNSHRDLGLIFSSDLSFTAHYTHITSRAYRVLGLIRRTFSRKSNVHGKKMLYLSLVRSQMFYCSQLWRPHLMKDIVQLERVQKRATKYILSDFDSDYKTRLITLDLLPLMYELELRDIMFCVKMLQSPIRDFNIKDYISFSDCGTRSSADP